MPLCTLVLVAKNRTRVLITCRWGLAEPTAVLSNRIGTIVIRRMLLVVNMLFSTRLSPGSLR